MQHDFTGCLFLIYCNDIYLRNLELVTKYIKVYPVPNIQKSKITKDKEKTKTPSGCETYDIK